MRKRRSKDEFSSNLNLALHTLKRRRRSGRINGSGVGRADGRIRSIELRRIRYIEQLPSKLELFGLFRNTEVFRSPSPHFPKPPQEYPAFWSIWGDGDGRKMVMESLQDWLTETWPMCLPVISVARAGAARRSMFGVWICLEP